MIITFFKCLNFDYECSKGTWLKNRLFISAIPHRFLMIVNSHLLELFVLLNNFITNLYTFFLTVLNYIIQTKKIRNKMQQRQQTNKLLCVDWILMLTKKQRSENITQVIYLVNCSVEGVIRTWNTDSCFIK